MLKWQPQLGMGKPRAVCAIKCFTYIALVQHLCKPLWFSAKTWSLVICLQFYGNSRSSFVFAASPLAGCMCRRTGASQYCGEAAKRSESDHLYVMGREIFKRDNGNVLNSNAPVTKRLKQTNKSTCKQMGSKVTAPENLRWQQGLLCMCAGNSSKTMKEQTVLGM